MVIIFKKINFIGFFLLTQYEVWVKLIYHYIWWVFIKARKQVLWRFSFKFEAVQVEENRLQIANPIPVAAPVTSAVWMPLCIYVILPFNFRIILRSGEQL